MSSRNGSQDRSSPERRTRSVLLFVLVTLSAVLWAVPQPTCAFSAVAPPCWRRRDCTRLWAKAVRISNEPWFPSLAHHTDEQQREQIERDAILLASRLIQRRLAQLQRARDGRNPSNGDGEALKENNGEQVEEEEEDKEAEEEYDDDTVLDARVQPYVTNRFLDLACRVEGERALETLFTGPLALEPLVDGTPDVLRGAVMAVQSLCVFATQVGVRGTPEQLRRLVSHLDPRRHEHLIQRDLLQQWDGDSVRRLKYQRSRIPAVQLLAALLWKRTTQGALDLLVALGAWERHEDVALLRSGFALRFSADEVEAAAQRAAEVAADDFVDPDDWLHLRRDLRHLKVYTIDGASASEIDDGVSVEKIPTTSPSEGGTADQQRHRIWVHIADAEHYAPPGSALFETARKRITSLYLPRGSVAMFPPLMSTEVMSLRVNRDSYALSMAVEINPDGSIDESSIEIVPSLIRVSYRLSYEEVDEMLEEGTAYAEEWELGVLLEMATTRRNYRIRNGSTEGRIPNPIPYSAVTIYNDKHAPGGIGISVKVEVSHNAGRNQTLESGSGDSSAGTDRVLENTVPASSSFLLVTEAMILAGEAMARWKRRVDCSDELLQNGEEPVERIPNRLRLPFRTQPQPDYRSRAAEKRVMNDLWEWNVGDGLCYSWYARRFLSPVKVTEIALPHAGLGLDCYVQWTSPIRRYSDLQVHAAVKRFLRRKCWNEHVANGTITPFRGLPENHLGFPPAERQRKRGLGEDDLDLDINYFEGIGLVGAARMLQRQSQQYWLFEHINRCSKRDPHRTFQAVVLGCVDPEKQQYAIYVYALGLEHRYLSPVRLDSGTRLRLKVQSASPRNGLLTFVRVP